MIDRRKRVFCFETRKVEGGGGVGGSGEVRRKSDLV